MWRFLKADEITKDDVGKAWESGSMSSSRCPGDAQAAHVPRCPKVINPRGGDGFLHASCNHAPLANHALHPLVVSPVTSKPDYSPATFSRANGCFTSTRGSRHLRKRVSNLLQHEVQQTNLANDKLHCRLRAPSAARAFGCTPQNNGRRRVRLW